MNSKLVCKYFTGNARVIEKTFLNDLEISKDKSVIESVDGKFIMICDQNDINEYAKMIYYSIVHSTNSGKVPSLSDNIYKKYMLELCPEMYEETEMEYYEIKSEELLLEFPVQGLEYGGFKFTSTKKITVLINIKDSRTNKGSVTRYCSNDIYDGKTRKKVKEAVTFLLLKKFDFTNGGEENEC